MNCENENVIKYENTFGIGNKTGKSNNIKPKVRFTLFYSRMKLPRKRECSTSASFLNFYSAFLYVGAGAGSAVAVGGWSKSKKTSGLGLRKHELDMFPLIRGTSKNRKLTIFSYSEEYSMLQFDWRAKLALWKSGKSQITHEILRI